MRKEGNKKIDALRKKRKIAVMKAISTDKYGEKKAQQCIGKQWYQKRDKQREKQGAFENDPPAFKHKTTKSRSLIDVENCLI